MQNSLIVPETDVLIATVIYLVERGVTPYQLSVPRGRGIDTSSAKNKKRNGGRATGII